MIVADGAALLRLLEPAVRPAGLPSAERSVSQPIESQSFDQLLAQVQDIGINNRTDDLEIHKQESRTKNIDGLETASENQNTSTRLLHLGGALGIENASLRQRLTSYETVWPGVGIHSVDAMDLPL